MKTRLMMIVFTALAGLLRAQISEVRIGVDGLTCSQCTRSVEVKLRQLPFVADVAMDLAHTSGVLRLKGDVPFRPAAIPAAVRDAGFTIRYVRLVVQNPGRYVSGGSCLSADGVTIQVDTPVDAGSGSPWILQLQGAPYDGKRKPPAVPDPSCGPGSIRATRIRK